MRRSKFFTGQEQTLPFILNGSVWIIRIWSVFDSLKLNFFEFLKTQIQIFHSGRITICFPPFCILNGRVWIDKIFGSFSILWNQTIFRISMNSSIELEFAGSALFRV